MVLVLVVRMGKRSSCTCIYSIEDPSMGRSRAAKCTCIPRGNRFHRPAEFFEESTPSMNTAEKMGT